MSKTLKGTVVSIAMKNTVVVTVMRTTRHPLYGKTIRKTKRYKAHTQNEGLHIGDTVIIQETRPISKETHFKVVSKE